MGKYQPLADHLVARAGAGQQTAEFDFADIANWLAPYHPRHFGIAPGGPTTTKLRPVPGERPAGMLTW